MRVAPRVLPQCRLHWQGHRCGSSFRHGFPAVPAPAGIHSDGLLHAGEVRRVAGSILWSVCITWSRMTSERLRLRRRLRTVSSRCFGQIDRTEFLCAEWLCRRILQVQSGISPEGVNEPTYLYSSLQHETMVPAMSECFIRR
jgi:hypothetical protein